MGIFGVDYERVIKHTTKKFEICIFEDNRGSFEHLKYGEEISGGLWFEGKELVDYDGVYNLPKEIVEELEDNGYDMSYAKDEE